MPFHAVPGSCHFHFSCSTITNCKGTKKYGKKRLLRRKSKNNAQRGRFRCALAKGIITDSGNVAEEATFNHVPCITLNSYTEHQETVKQGTNVLVGEDADCLASELHRLLADDWTTGQLPDRWDGRTAERIVSMLCS